MLNCVARLLHLEILACKMHAKKLVIFYYGMQFTFSILFFLTFLKYSSMRMLASGTVSHTIRIWNETNNYLTNSQTGKNLISLEYDQYNQLIMAGCKEKSILLWNIQSNTNRIINTDVSVDAI